MNKYMEHMLLRAREVNNEMVAGNFDEEAGPFCPFCDADTQETEFKDAWYEERGEFPMLVPDCNSCPLKNHLGPGQMIGGCIVGGAAMLWRWEHEDMTWFAQKYWRSDEEDKSL